MRDRPAPRSDQVECLAEITLPDDDIAACEAMPSHSFGNVRELSRAELPERRQTTQALVNDGRLARFGARIVDAVDHGQPASAGAAGIPGTAAEQPGHPVGQLSS